MKSYPLTVSSPDGNLFEGEAIFLALRGTQGDLAIMAGHTPFMTAVQPGECKIILPDDTEKFAHIEGGLLTVSETNVTLLSSGFQWK